MSSSHFVGAISSVRHLPVPPLAGHPHRLVHVADGLANAVPNQSSIASTNRCKINETNKTAHDSEGDIRKHEPIGRLLVKSEAELAMWRNAIREALDPNGRLLIELVPELKRILGEQPSVPELPPQDAKRRFQLVFRRFIGVFARPEYPLALFLDDLQWLDSATLEALVDLLTQADVQHLFVIGAYRDNEVDSAHPLARKLEGIRRLEPASTKSNSRRSRRRTWRN